ncbi:MAG TPA: WXG100 family type VII secretion target [Pseudonocardiaceae bacterium]|nr:WXG100 family type VII secretion target [Pseudonocardiaceae bacterium]
MSTPEQRTNFAQYSHQQLYAMLYAGNPDSARNAAAAWNDTGNGLHDQANQLAKQLSGFAQSWTGGAAEQYQTMVNDLIGGIRKVADTAYAMRDLADDAADAQDTARAEMPAPVDVPSVPPATLALASAPIQVDAGTPATVVAQIQQARASAIAAVQGQQQASAAADAAHAKAVQVMTTLAGAYVSAQAAIPPAPDAATAPNLTAANAIQGGALAASPIGAPSGMTVADPLAADLPWSQSGTLAGLPTTPGDPTAGLTSTDPGAATQDNPLFGGMFSAGVAAASAAVFGRFGSLIPKVPAFADKSGNGKPADGSTAKNSDGAPGGTPKLGDRLASGAGGAQIGGVGGIGGLKGGVGAGAAGVGSPSAPTPSAGPSMLGAGNVGGDVAAGVAGAAGAAARSTTGMPMMPMMPMSGMGGGDMGGGRRIPPWLVETEDVWGESSAVSPTVIGKEPDLGQNWLG